MSAETDSRVQYIQECLNEGFTDSQIASGLGVTQSAVTQLIERYNLAPREKLTDRYSELDGIYDELEMKIAKKLRTSIGLISGNPIKLAQVASRINALKRRSIEVSSPERALPQQAALVNLQIPVAISQANTYNITMSDRNEVIAVDGRTFDTATPKHLEEFAAKIKKSGNLEEDEAFASLIQLDETANK